MCKPGYWSECVIFIILLVAMSMCQVLTVHYPSIIKRLNGAIWGWTCNLYGSTKHESLTNQFAKERRSGQSRLIISMYWIALSSAPFWYSYYLVQLELQCIWKGIGWVYKCRLYILRGRYIGHLAGDNPQEQQRWRSSTCSKATLVTPSFKSWPHLSVGFFHKLYSYSPLLPVFSIVPARDLLRVLSFVLL